MKWLTKTKTKLFLRISFSYLVILLIPILLNMITHTMSMRAIRDKSTEYNTSQLTGIIHNVDNRLYRIQEAAQQLSMERTVQNLMNSSVPLDGQRMLEFQEATETVFNYLNNKDFIGDENYYLYFPGYDLIMTSDTVYSPELYHRSVIMQYRSDPGLYAAWRKKIAPSEPENAFYYSSYDSIGYPDSDRIIYMQTLPLPFDRQARAMLVIEIPRNAIGSLFRAGQPERSFSYIQGREGRIAAFGDDHLDLSPVASGETGRSVPTEVNGETIIATTLVSEHTGWSFVTLTPESELYGALLHIQHTYYVAVAIVLVLGIGMAFFFAHSNSGPILQILEALAGYFGSNRQEYPVAKDPYSMITTGVSALIAKQTDMQLDLLEQKNHLRGSMLNELLTGRFHSGDRLPEMAEYLELPLEGDCFCLGLLSFGGSGTEDLSARKKMIRTELTRAVGNQLILHDTDLKRITCIFNLSAIKLEPGSFESFIFPAMRTVRASLLQNHNIEILMGFSGYCQQSWDVWRILSQAEQALRFASVDNPVVLHASIAAQAQAYYYPEEVEEWLVRAAKAGDFEQIERNLDILYRENIAQRRLSGNDRQALLLTMYSTVRQLAKQLPGVQVHMNTRDVGKSRRASDSFDEIRSLYRQICEQQADERDSAKQRFITEVTDYIETYYTDSALGLHSIASHFNLSESYFSLLFKENVGMNFADFLEKVRLSKSVELLQTTGLTIDTIAAQVGYNSGQSFRRAFKKIYSHSPTQLRAQSY